MAEQEEGSKTIKVTMPNHIHQKLKKLSDESEISMSKLMLLASIADLYAFNVQNPLPAFPLPLRSGDTEPIINLQELFTGIYDIANYDLKIDYHNWEPIPPLSEANTIWADALLRDRGLRHRSGLKSV